MSVDRLAAELAEARSQIAALQQRMTQLEAMYAVARGTLAPKASEPEDYTSVITNAPPSAPPHGEPGHE